MQSLYNHSPSTKFAHFLFPPTITPEQTDRLDKQLESYFKRNSVTASDLKAQANKAEGTLNNTSSSGNNNNNTNHVNNTDSTAGNENKSGAIAAQQEE